VFHAVISGLPQWYWNRFIRFDFNKTRLPLTLSSLFGYKKASTRLEEASFNGMEVEALSKKNRGRPSLNSPGHLAGLMRWVNSRETTYEGMLCQAPVSKTLSLL
jgi:hypothetical protein